MRLVIRILLALGVVITMVTFPLNPFSKRTGLLIILLGIVAGLTEGLMIGIPMVGIGSLLMIIWFLYHHKC
ncbi:MAG: hypothetical protein AB1847_10785 [bacterium]